MPRKKPQSEAEFLAGYDPSVYERPSLTVDVALLSVVDDALATLLVRRAEHPWEGAAALPGGFVRIDESIERAAERVLADKAGLEGVFLEQLYTFGDVERDPRTRVVTVAHYALVDGKRFEALDRGLTARLEVPWEGETGGPVDVRVDGAITELAFDHADILGMAVKRQRDVDHRPAALYRFVRRSAV